MKKFLSMILALIMVISMLPTSFAAVDGATGVITYDFTYESRNQTENAKIHNVDSILPKFATYPKDQTPADTDAKDQWIYLGVNSNYSGTGSSSPWARIDNGDPYILTNMGPNHWPVSETGAGEGYMALQIYVPAAGTYDLSLGIGKKMNTASQNVDIYLGKTTETLNQEYFISEKVKGTVTNLQTGATNPYTGQEITDELTNRNIIRESAKKFSELGIPKNYLKASGVNLKVVANTPLEEPLVVDKPGDYLLIMHNKDTDSNGNRLLLSSLTLTPVAEEEPEEPETVSGKVSFCAYCDVSNAITVTGIEGYISNNQIDSVPVGSTIEAVADTTNPNYIFRGWKRGSKDNGVYVSDNPKYSFTALTNTFLTAIYEQKAETEGNTAIVEFYNGNGQYLAKATSTVGDTVTIPEAAATPTLTGFAFANEWKTEDGAFTAKTKLTKKLTRAVAQFNPLSTKFTVTCDNEEVLLTYGSKHTFKNDKAVYWMREGAVVEYGTSYTHAAWDDALITTSSSGEFKPVVLLDADDKDGAYMIEYNAAGEEILEVGIVFGSGDVSIERCGSKATSQYKNQHGQFTAKPYNSEDTVARGYMIYKDENEDENGSYKVVYSN